MTVTCDAASRVTPVWSSDARRAKVYRRRLRHGIRRLPTEENFKKTTARPDPARPTCLGGCPAPFSLAAIAALFVIIMVAIMWSRSSGSSLHRTEISTANDPAWARSRCRGADHPLRQAGRELDDAALIKVEDAHRPERISISRHPQTAAADLSFGAGRRPTGPERAA